MRQGFLIKPNKDVLADLFLIKMWWRLRCDTLVGRRRQELLWHLHKGGSGATGVPSFQAPIGGEKPWQKLISYE